MPRLDVCEGLRNLRAKRGTRRHERQGGMTVTARELDSRAFGSESSNCITFIPLGEN
jgi:hypothetical protein